MDYQLENLGPERFQEVCQALLAKSFPNIQCFPIGQRDAGRDGTSFVVNSEEDGFIVFQMKFVRKPLAVKDAHKWLIDVLGDEAPKVNKLIPKGAIKYYFLTNVPGTAYPESGSIDSVQKVFEDNIRIPSMCLWRDDLNRRLDDAVDIKWAYPEILSGPDVLRVLVENKLTEHSERRTSAIRSYVRDQFEREKEVRFKQVELQNKLLDLFVDVPITLRDWEGRKGVKNKRVIMKTIAQRLGVEIPWHRNDLSLGAASFLLDSTSQTAMSRIVVEGAPGQGKSTISQYVCQIHRRKILNESINDTRIPAHHRANPLRLPFKIDCRDLATWLRKKNPFEADESANVPDGWKKSLESFLAAQVSHHSGGAEFSVSDLHAVSKLSPFLLVFDGLDEVADIKARKEVVEEIAKGANRLEEIADSVQTIVTSRPAAYANAPGFSERTFQYLELISIDRPQIEEYAGKWLKARRLDGREAADVRRILKNKLDQPHLRELARNPMQLAILLSLIQTRGGSLPDKRTALYDNYVELFFNREAEKSSVVREHRDLLIDIHQFLAWHLHSEAQTAGNRGSISTENLKKVVNEYLTSEGHETNLGDLLFTGMVERVVALVSRVEGTYEFEVQPLREYFAARYLFNTAPYSPAGNEKSGTLPDRFNALARDFFWQNVVRFFCGCYSKGQLGSLVDCLVELSDDELFQHTNHARQLSTTLLSDWVFAQHPNSMKRVVHLVLDGPGLRFVAANQRDRRRYHGVQTISLPDKCGRSELIERCFQLLNQKNPIEYVNQIVKLINENASKQEIEISWKAGCKGRQGTDLTKWLHVGLRLGCLASASENELSEFLAENDEFPRRLRSLLRAGHTDYIESSEVRFEKTLDLYLDTNADLFSRRRPGLLSALSKALDPRQYSVAIENRVPRPLIEVREHYGSEKPEEDNIEPPTFSIAARVHSIVEQARSLSRDVDASTWATSIGPWNRLIEKSRRELGNRWVFCVFANVAAGIRSKTETCDSDRDLFDDNLPLCSRTRYARLRAGSPNWWKSKLEDVENNLDRLHVLLVAFTWCGASLFENYFELVDEVFRKLEDEDRDNLMSELRFMSFALRQERPTIKIDEKRLPSGLSATIVAALSPRLDEELSAKLYEKYVLDSTEDNKSVMAFSQRVALYKIRQDPSKWEEWLPVIAKSYNSSGIVIDRYFGQYVIRNARNEVMPPEVARKIVSSVESYPLELIYTAERQCRQAAAEKSIPVGLVAKSENWFSESQ